MTVAAFPPYTYYLGDGVLTSFAYPFEVERQEDFAAFHNDTLVTNYTLSGLGNETGGQCTFSAPPAPGVSILLLRRLPLDQETMYPAYSPFPAAAHEKTLDRLCMQVWQEQEQLERTTRFKQTIDPQHRNLLYPDPLPNGLLGWDSAAAQWTLHPSGVQQITVNPTSGIGSGKNVVAVTPTFGAGQAQALVFPAGVLAVAVTGWIETAFGTTQGLSALGIGTPESPDRWGYLTQLTAGSESTAGLFQGYSGQPQLAGGIITLTAYGGAFDGTGTVYLTGHFNTFQPSHTVGSSYTPGGPEDQTPLPVGTPLSVTRYSSTGNGIESTPGLLTTSDGRLGVNSTPDATDMVRVVALGATGANLTLSRAADSTGAMVLQLHKSRGTEAAPTLVQASDQLGSVHWQGRTRDSGNTQDVDLNLAILRAYVEAVDASQRASGQVRVFTSEASAVVTEKLRLTAAGNLLLGTTTHGTSLRAGLVLGSGTMATAAHPVDAVQIVAEDFEGVAGTTGLRVRSEDGVTTRIGTGVLSRKVVLILSTQTLAAPYLLTEEESGKVLVCTNATMVQVTLPLAVVGLVYTVLLYVAAGVRIRANTADTIRLGGTTGTAAGYLESTTLHGTITLLAVNASAWMATSVVGTWTHGV